MKNQYLIAFLGSVFVLASCSNQLISYASFSDWDKSNDSFLDRNEFVEGYIYQDFFDKWNPTGNSMSYDKFFNEMYLSIDRNKDAAIDKGEFDSQIKRFFFGMFSESFESWDQNKDGKMRMPEFTKNASASKLASLWDSNSDRVIYEREMAEGMFYICDSDNSGKIFEAELNDWRDSRP